MVALALIVAFLIDAILADPYWLYHPVCYFGTIIKIIKKGMNKTYLNGFILLIATIILSLLPIYIIRVITKSINDYAYYIYIVLFSYMFIARKCLVKESNKIKVSIKNEDLEGARKNIGMLVSRDTDKFSFEDCSRACVETVAENSSDGVIAPIFYFVVGAIIGYPILIMALYKVVNTLDSMVGYKEEEYFEIGYFSAKFDDVLNFIPSRIASVLLIIASMILGYNWKKAIYIFRRDRNKHASPNAGQVESVVAGALDITLGGDGVYFGKIIEKAKLGDGNKKIGDDEIRKTNNLLNVASVIWLLTSWGILWII